MQTEQQALIDLYLKNEEQLYKDRYATLHPVPPDPDTVPFGIKESLAELKRRFEGWWGVGA